MAIAIAAGPTVLEDASNGTTVSGSFILANGSTAGRLVEVRASFKTFNNTASLNATATVTFDGVSCTQQVTINDYANNQDSYSAIFTIPNASLPAIAGTYIVTLTVDNTMQSRAIEIIEYSGVDTIVSTASGATYGTSLTLTPATSGAYQSAVFQAATTSTITSSITTGTEQYNNRIGAQSVALQTTTGYATGGSVAVSFSADPNSETGCCVAYSALAGGISINLPVATETDSAQAIGKTKTKAVPVATETGVAQALGRSKLYSLLTASETDIAQALSKTKIYTLPTASEIDVAIIITKLTLDIIIAVATATETDSAQTIGKTKTKQLTPATELDSAQNLTIEKVYQLTPAISGNTAQSLGVSKVLALVPATETDTAVDFGKAKIYPVATAEELDEAVAIALAGAGVTLTPADIQAIVNALIADGRVLTLQKWLIWREIL